jgi:hypothetical protein
LPRQTAVTIHLFSAEWPQHEIRRVAVAPVVNPRLPAILTKDVRQPLDFIPRCISGIKRESWQSFPIRENRVSAAAERKSRRRTPDGLNAASKPGNAAVPAGRQCARLIRATGSRT